MASLFKSTKNTRSIMNDSMRYIRSDAIINLEYKEMQWLLENNILTVVDLRTTEEVIENPCCLKDYTNFTYLNIPVSFGDEIPETPEMVPQLYLKMVDGTMKKIISIIENSKTNVVYFCKSGKDRTGVVSALLLLKQGISQDHIISDYMLSADNIKEVIEQYCSDYPNVKKEALTPNPEYIKQFLKCVRL